VTDRGREEGEKQAEKEGRSIGRSMFKEGEGSRGKKKKKGKKQRGKRLETPWKKEKTQTSGQRREHSPPHEQRGWGVNPAYGTVAKGEWDKGRVRESKKVNRGGRKGKGRRMTRRLRKRRHVSPTTQAIVFPDRETKTVLKGSTARGERIFFWMGGKGEVYFATCGLTVRRACGLEGNRRKE